MNSLLAVTVTVTVLAATAAAAVAYIPTPLSAVFLFSPPFLWVAANVIIIWLLSSSRSLKGTAADASSAGHADDVLNAVDELYPSSEYEAFSDAGHGHRADAPVSKRQAREARTARRTDRLRVRKKPAGEDEPSKRALAAEARGKPDDKRRGEEMPVTVAATEAAKPDDGDDGDLDSTWQSIVQRRAARRVAVPKSETWGSDVLPRLKRAADTAAARREMRKSVSAVVAPAPPSAARQLGWRTRDVLVMAQDELLRRAESLIRRHHEQLRLQRQESEQHRALELQCHRPAHALIRV